MKQVLCAYSTKWMHSYTDFLKELVIDMLNDFKSFLTVTEPLVEAVSGNESDTVTFMRCMRLFNEVKTQQVEVDAKFGAMRRTVTLLDKFGHNLPDEISEFLVAAPHRWSNMKKKVARAKQRIGPQIQAAFMSISKDLVMFGDLCQQLYNEFAGCEAFVHGYAVDHAETTIKTFDNKLKRLEHQAQVSNNMYIPCV